MNLCLCDRPELIETAAQWFHKKWGVPLAAYLESMNDSLTASAVPRWYVMLGGNGEIIGGLGVIENDFHDRPDLRPNVCAVYVEPEHRCKGIAGRLLERVCDDMAALGEPVLYLLTDHDSFYEHYGWEFSTAWQPATARKRRAECTYIRTPTSIELAGIFLHYVISGVENRFVIFSPSVGCAGSFPIRGSQKCLLSLHDK